jgi:hypothetical protein
MRSAHESVTATSSATKRERILIAAHRGEGMDSPGDQLTALLDAANALSRASIPYALIGGIAVGIHSQVPRATQDIDVAVPSTASREAIITALQSQSFELVGEFPHSLNLRHPNGERVQAAIDPLFDEMIERAEQVVVGGTSIHIVTAADLLAMKERAAADPARRRSKALRDQADIELLRGDVPDPDEGW